MTKGFLSKSFLPVINDSMALAQVFVVVLFFENYLIYFQKISLFSLSVDFGSIELAPFLWFFVFIATFKIFWWGFHVMMIPIRLKLKLINTDMKISSKIHFTSFLLVCLISLYFYNIYADNHAFVPFDVELHPFLFNIFQIPAITTLFIGLVIIFVADIEYQSDIKKAA